MLACPFNENLPFTPIGHKQALQPQAGTWLHSHPVPTCFELSGRHTSLVTSESMASGCLIKSQGVASSGLSVSPVNAHHSHLPLSHQGDIRTTNFVLTQNEQILVMLFICKVTSIDNFFGLHGAPSLLAVSNCRTHVKPSLIND